MASLRYREHSNGHEFGRGQGLLSSLCDSSELLHDGGHRAVQGCQRRQQPWTPLHYKF